MHRSDSEHTVSPSKRAAAKRRADAGNGRRSMTSL
jgi:hypothetical protein